MYRWDSDLDLPVSQRLSVHMEWILAFGILYPLHRKYGRMEQYG